MGARQRRVVERSRAAAAPALLSPPPWSPGCLGVALGWSDGAWPSLFQFLGVSEHHGIGMSESTSSRDADESGHGSVLEPGRRFFSRSRLGGAGEEEPIPAPCLGPEPETGRGGIERHLQR